MTWLAESTLRRLGTLTPEEFLRDHWQRKPLFIKNAVPEIAGLLDGNDLAGLALEDEVESRIVVRHAADAKHPDGKWELKRGPFTEKTFGKLPAKDWTLLVQAVDQYLPEAAELLERFTFLPNWRIDDLMVSYAVDGGGVGPHYDSYDVFLIQGVGTRVWRIGPEVDDSGLLPHPDLRILKSMPVTEEFVCEPGDLLYLPPRMAHWGIARGECMTYSVGFRAPSDRELVDGFCNHLIGRIPELQRYSDAGIARTAHPGRIEPSAIAALRGRLTALLNEPGLLEDFLGLWLSEAKYGARTTPPETPWTAAALGKALAKAAQVRRDETSRFLLVADGIAPTLYIDGDCLPLSGPDALAAASLVADHRLIDGSALRALLDRKAAADLVLGLFNSGHLYIPDASTPE